MTPFYKTLIVISTLISLFFFGKWGYKVWPRYDIKKGIADYSHYSDIFGKEFCDNKKYLDCFCQPKKVEKPTTTIIYSWGYGFEELTCYTKEKVRIN